MSTGPGKLSGLSANSRSQICIKLTGTGCSGTGSKEHKYLYHRRTQDNKLNSFTVSGSGYCQHNLKDTVFPLQNPKQSTIHIFILINCDFMSQLYLNVNILYTQFCAARMYGIVDYLIRFVTVLLEYIIVLSKLLCYSSWADMHLQVLVSSRPFLKFVSCSGGSTIQWAMPFANLVLLVAAMLQLQLRSKILMCPV